ncbi:paraneoplastic antigen Ma1 homolog [Dendropsophus ebraccatus]|uniref:paraneoplastic antigen Ma1 homolog n=1 Tax=Dendropsophus ebraccatus TaxID=150705 RepID=UPI003831C890
MGTFTEDGVFKWCEETSTAEEYSFAVYGELLECSDNDILQNVNWLHGVIHPKVVDRRNDFEKPWSAALIATEQVLQKEFFPSAISVSAERGQKWIIIWPLRPVETQPQGSNSPDRRPHRRLPPTPSRATSEETSATADILVATMEKLVSQFAKMQPEGSYRRLRTFSGVLPTPAGEEGYDIWRDATLQYLEEWQCTDAAKKQRIVESLKGPAMEVVQAAWRSKPHATSQDYMAALEDAFGSPEDGVDLLYKLRTTYQDPGEKMSDYLYRLDKLIHRVVSKGGISSAEVDKCRLDQVLRGALTHDPIAQRLRCCDKEKIPHSFPKLLKEVRHEEAILAARELKPTRVAAVALESKSPGREEELLKVIEKQGEQISQLLSVQTEQVEWLRQIAEAATERPQPLTKKIGDHPQRSRDPKTEGCFICGDHSHIARQCPKKWEFKEPVPPPRSKGKMSGNGKGGQ